MNGLETARELRRHLGDDVPILLISAYDWTEIEEEARLAGITGFISKPLFKSTLFQGLKRFAEAKPEPGELQQDRTVADWKGKRILLTEDNELNWEVASTLLQEYGFDLDWAENGQVCVDMFRESPQGYYDVVLMDIRLPVMNGVRGGQKHSSHEQARCQYSYHSHDGRRLFRGYPKMSGQRHGCARCQAARYEGGAARAPKVSAMSHAVPPF